MARKKKEPTKEQMIACQSIPSFTEADGATQIIKENIDQQENLFEEDSPDKKEAEADRADFQPSHGRLETVDERFEELDVESIQPIGLIPDYLIPTDLKYPVVAKTPLNYYCLDGWNLIQEATASGKVVLKCFIEEIKEHCNEELAIRKVVLRERPRGGICSYAERVRNATYLKDILLASDMDPKVFQHGGSRRGAAFTNNKEENVTKLLSSRLGKSESTISQYISHGFYLTNLMLNFLAQKEADKNFFEQAQPNKRIELRDLTSRKASEYEILTQISRKMVDWYKEYKTTGKITPVWNQGEVNTETDSARRGASTVSSRNPRLAKSDRTQAVAANEADDDDIEAEETTEAEITLKPVFNPLRPEVEEEQGNSDSFEKVKADVEELGQRLLAAATLDDPDIFWERILEETTCLSRISLRAAFFRKEGGQQ